MRSIRRSLIAYFLLLLGVALGVSGALVNRFADDIIQARETAEAKRIRQEFEVKCQESRNQFDEKLKDQAEALGRELRSSLNPSVYDETRRVSAVLTGFPTADLGLAWQGTQLLTLLARDPGVHRWISRSYEWHLHDERIQRSFDGDNHPDFFQFHFPRFNYVLRGSGNVVAPPLDVNRLNRTPEFDHEYEDVPNVPGVGSVRRIVLKTPFLVPFRGIRDMRPRGAPPRPAVGPPAESVESYPFVYVQCGRRKQFLDDRIAEHEQKRDADLDQITAETADAMARLRGRLAGVGGTAFLAVLVGGWVLVGRGLAPIRKLSDAVSRVSEKDFKLPIDKTDLSRELVPIHDRLTQTLSALRGAFEREKQAVADISHELRTPLAAMLTTLEVSLRKPRQAEQYRATLEECRDIGKQLGRLVERIMTLAQMDAGTDRVRPEPFDAGEVAVGCVTIIRPLAAAHGLTLTTDIAPAAYAHADPDRVREVLLNLLHNAIEYNRPDGSIHLIVAADPGGVRCEVRDTGIGMSPEVTAKIFERFFRADPSRHATGMHAGLGLAIVKEYLDRMGATIAVESKPWVGSTFRVTLPPAQVDDPAPAEMPAGAAVS